MNAAYRAAADRVLARSDTDPQSGCIRFTGATSTSGYGSVSVHGVGSRGAHRVVYIAATGRPIPDGLTLDHLCHSTSECIGDASCPHRLCVNPDHLEPVTAAENLRRQWSARKPHCSRGHLFDEANTYINGGRRNCRTCKRIRKAQWDKADWARRRGLTRAVDLGLPLAEKRRLLREWDAANPVVRWEAL